MSFRKPSHEEMMPLVVMCVLRPGWQGTILGMKGFADPVTINKAKGMCGVIFNTRNLTELHKIRDLEYKLGVYPKDVRAILEAVWTTVVEEDVNATMEVLTKWKLLTRVGRSNSYRIEIPKPNHATSRGSPAHVVSSGLPRSPKLREKPGECPSCGMRVKYANRHARSGSAHSGEECQMNKIRSVMEG